MTDPATTPGSDARPAPVEGLAALSTEELRERAFSLARRRLDLSFFWDVIEHLPHSYNAETDGSVGSIGSVIDNIVETYQEFHGRGYGEEEPLLRAAFIDYIEKHGKKDR
ncbi:hypothetical protein AB0I28_04870 [Phytomonospora sp. NPDC050363]|uniref:hypothetical protein n=1 Tax=Phytomonospora sp. NPDC050363 TaxID=3155642 RepID=UPI0033ECCDB4